MEPDALALNSYRNAPIVPPSRNGDGPAGDKKLYDACVDFESVFIKQMLDTMRKTVPQEGLLDGGFAQDIYQDMQYQQYAETMAKNAHFGIARLLYNQLSGQATGS